MGKSFWVIKSKGLFSVGNSPSAVLIWAFGECCRGLSFSVLIIKLMPSFVQVLFSANVRFDTSNRKSDN